MLLHLFLRNAASWWGPQFLVPQADKHSGYCSKDIKKNIKNISKTYKNVKNASKIGIAML